MMNLSVPRESRRGQLYNSPQISHRIEEYNNKKIKIIKIIGCILII